MRVSFAVLWGAVVEADGHALEAVTRVVSSFVRYALDSACAEWARAVVADGVVWGGCPSHAACDDCCLLDVLLAVGIAYAAVLDLDRLPSLVARTVDPSWVLSEAMLFATFVSAWDVPSLEVLLSDWRDALNGQRRICALLLTRFVGMLMRCVWRREWISDGVGGAFRPVVAAENGWPLPDGLARHYPLVTAAEQTVP
jgi:hypothetical protein